jgi:hypothetical protein
MKKSVKQVIPAAQKQIIIDALDLMLKFLEGLKSEDENIHYKMFDILCLKGMLSGEVSSDNHGVDFPIYS